MQKYTTAPSTHDSSRLGHLAQSNESCRPARACRASATSLSSRRSRPERRLVIVEGNHSCHSQHTAQVKGLSQKSTWAARYRTHTAATGKAQPRALDPPAIFRIVAVPIRDDFDFRPSNRRHHILAIPKRIFRSVALEIDLLLLRRNALLKHARVGFGRAPCLVAVADDQWLAIFADIDERVVRLLQRNMEEHELLGESDVSIES